MSSRKVSQPTGSNFQFYSDESPGLKLAPSTVLIMSIMYVGVVVLLHFFGKLTRPAAPPTA